MKLYRNPGELPCPGEKSYVTIGNFDGVHLGHQRLFARVVELARHNGGISVVVTFVPHPRTILSAKRPRQICTLEQKIELIERAGLDELLIVPFDRATADTSAEDFLQKVLLHGLGMKGLVVGFDYAMGKNRAGDINFLRAQGVQKGFFVEVIEACLLNGQVVSSSAIRELVAAGEMEAARALMGGRCYQISGEVRHGHKRGGQVLGFPTANVQILEEELCPRHGVYVAQVLYNGKRYGGIANIGLNPTFAENALGLEAHLFDFNDDIYGKPLRINLLRHLRDERRFSSPEALAEQIAGDIAQARDILAKEEKGMISGRM